MLKLNATADPKPAKQFLSTTELADVLQVSVNTIRWWRHDGRGPKAVKAGRRVLYPVAEVEAWLEAQN